MKKLRELEVEIPALVRELVQNLEDSIRLSTPSLEWRDCTKEEPPPGPVLVCAYGDIQIGYYYKVASEQKGCRLPNSEACAVWHLERGEGPSTVKHFMILPQKPK